MLAVDIVIWVFSAFILHSVFFCYSIYRLREDSEDYKEKLRCIEEHLGIRVTVTRKLGATDILVERIKKDE